MKEMRVGPKAPSAVGRDSTLWKFVPRTSSSTNGSFERQSGRPRTGPSTFNLRSTFNLQRTFNRSTGTGFDMSSKYPNVSPKRVFDQLANNLPRKISSFSVIVRTTSTSSAGNEDDQKAGLDSAPEPCRLKPLTEGISWTFNASFAGQTKRLLRSSKARRAPLVGSRSSGWQLTKREWHPSMPPSLFGLRSTFSNRFFGPFAMESNVPKKRL
mmetsp:Transcript_43597/g.93924  ORF Transcript_43597/g.93924 Transcript_43597/m.93924 type:complete len:212 (-) Transcript_43597:341-976(-)